MAKKILLISGPGFGVSEILEEKFHDEGFETNTLYCKDSNQIMECLQHVREHGEEYSGAALALVTDLYFMLPAFRTQAEQLLNEVKAKIPNIVSISDVGSQRPWLEQLREDNIPIIALDDSDTLDKTVKILNRAINRTDSHGDRAKSTKGSGFKQLPGSN